MGNKKANDLGIDTFMNNVKNNKSVKEQEEIVIPSTKSVSEEVFLDTSKEQSEKGNNTQGTLLRNIVLTPETLYRIEAVQKMQEKRISIGGLMGAIIEEYLDINYPQTKELYRLMESMKK